MFDCFALSEYDHEMVYGEQKIAKDMKNEQLRKKFYCSLKKFDIGSQNLIFRNNFVFKTTEIQPNPNWPSFLKFLTAAKIPILDLSNSFQKVQNNSDLLACAIGGKPFPSTLRVLNLSRNKITKEGAKFLAPALENNKTLQFLDLSSNELGVYGVTLIAKALQKNSTLKSLNLFKNTFDVDGSRALREMLKVNNTIEFLEIGHNRIREKGLEAITEGILSQEKSKLKTLGLRLNFINDDGFTRFFDEVVLSGMVTLENLYVSQNNLTEYKATKLQ